jgi:hypothetical protein
MQQHFISGSRKVAGSDGKSLSYIDKVDNHYLLANAYSALAEAVCGLSAMHAINSGCERVNALGSRHGVMAGRPLV